MDGTLTTLTVIKTTISQAITSNMASFAPVTHFSGHRYSLSASASGVGKRPSANQRSQPSANQRTAHTTRRASHGQLSKVQQALAAEAAERSQVIQEANYRAYLARRDNRQQYARKQLARPAHSNATRRFQKQKPAWMAIRDAQRGDAQRGDAQRSEAKGTFETLYLSDDEDEAHTVDTSITSFPALNGATASSSVLMGSWAQRSKKAPSSVASKHDTTRQATAAADDNPEEIAASLDELPPPPPTAHKRCRKRSKKAKKAKKTLKLPEPSQTEEALDFSVFGSSFGTGKNWGDYDTDED